MPAPTFVGVTAVASGTGALSVAAVVGAVAGDLVFLFVESANEVVATPSGFLAGPIAATGTAAAAGGVRLSVFYRVLTAADATTSVADSGNHTVAVKIAYRGVDVSDLFTPEWSGRYMVGVFASGQSNAQKVVPYAPDVRILYAAALDIDLASTAVADSMVVQHAPLEGFGSGTVYGTVHAQRTISSGVGGGLVVGDAELTNQLYAGCEVYVGLQQSTAGASMAIVLHPQAGITAAPVIRRALTVSASATLTVGESPQQPFRLSGAARVTTTSASETTPVAVRGAAAGDIMVAAAVRWSTPTTSPAGWTLRHREPVPNNASYVVEVYTTPVTQQMGSVKAFVAPVVIPGERPYVSVLYGDDSITVFQTRRMASGDPYNTLLFTEDGGATWHELAFPPRMPPPTVVRFSGQTLLYFPGGLLIRGATLTAPSYTTYSPAPPLPWNLDASPPVSVANGAVFRTDGGDIYRSTDGENFTLVHQSSYVVRPGVFYVGGEFRAVSRTFSGSTGASLLVSADGISWFDSSYNSAYSFEAQGQAIEVSGGWLCRGNTMVATYSRSNYGVWFSSDGWNWVLRYGAETTGVLCKRGSAVTCFEHLSEDGGATWSRTYRGESSLVTAQNNCAPLAAGVVSVAPAPVSYYLETVKDLGPWPAATANYLSVSTWRGADESAPIGVTAVGTGTGGTVTLPALTSGPTSVVVGGIASTSAVRVTAVSPPSTPVYPNDSGLPHFATPTP